MHSYCSIIVSYCFFHHDRYEFCSIKGQEDCSYFFNQREQMCVATLDQEFERIYQQRPKTSLDLVYFLGDNPSFSRTWSAFSGKLPCFRRNKGFYVHRPSGKVLTPADKLTALGWPTTKPIADSMLVSQLPSLDTGRAELMAGNAMLLGNCSIVMLVGLTCFRKRNMDNDNVWN